MMSQAVENIVIKDSSTAGTDAALTVYDGTVAAYGGPTSVNIDASELDGGISTFDEVFTLTGTGSSAMPLNVTSGGGADILDGVGNDTISGGAGIDIIDGVTLV